MATPLTVEPTLEYAPWKLMRRRPQRLDPLAQRIFDKAKKHLAEQETDEEEAR